MNPEDIIAYRQRYRLTQSDLAAGIGYATDGQRVVRAMEVGYRKGKPYKVTGPVVRSMEYIAAILEVARNPNTPVEARLRLLEALPDELKRKC